MTEDEKLIKMIADERFTTVDYKLRRGAHISVEDVDIHDFIKANFEDLSKFYRRYDAALIEGAEGYYYLVSEGSILGQRQLSKAEMLIGLSIAHLYRDPENRVKGTGELTAEQVILRLEALKSKKEIARLVTESKVKSDLHPSKVREATLDAIKKLAALNFLYLLDSSGISFRCKRPIHRFDQFVSQIDSSSEEESAKESSENGQPT
jgi:chromosome condensin MukBEF MukE localization factor